MRLKEPTGLLQTSEKFCLFPFFFPTGSVCRMRTPTRKEEQDHLRGQGSFSLKLMAFCCGYMEGSESFQLLGETYGKAVNILGFSLLIDKLSMLVSTIRLPAPFSERQTELLLLQLNQAF